MLNASPAGRTTRRSYQDTPNEPASAITQARLSAILWVRIRYCLERNVRLDERMRLRGVTVQAAMEGQRMTHPHTQDS